MLGRSWINGVREINLKEYEQIELELNCHTKALLRMMGLKDNHNGNRLQQACTAEGINFAVLYSLRKDHKPIEEGQEVRGPKTRPVCGCRDCGTKRISYLLCQILRPLISESKTQCSSTQELLSAIDALNENENTLVEENWIVGSLDIEALFPSLDVAVCAEIAGRVLFESTIEFRNLQWKEIMMYLRFMLTDEELEQKGLQGYTPQRKTRRGRPPLFTASGSCADSQTRMQPWDFGACSEPNEQETRKVWCESIKILIKQVMKNHCFKFQGKLFKQEEGGSIGLDLTGIMAEIYMSWWDRELILLLREDGICVVFHIRRYG